MNTVVAGREQGRRRHVLVEQPLPRVGRVGADRQQLTVGEVGDPAHRVFERERHRREGEDRGGRQPDADADQERAHGSQSVAQVASDKESEWLGH
jgi:hypothetical protein